MTSLDGAPSESVGAQLPRRTHCPPYISSTGAEAVELAAMAGLDLDPWQQWSLTQSLGERPDGMWAAFGVGVVVPRQNGKGGLLEARELAGLFLLGERLIIHSAHQFDTSQEAFERLVALIENTPELNKRLAKNGISRSHGSEGVKLKNGQRIRFRTRTKGGGRGFTCDCLILDEAMILPDAFMSAVLPTLSARPNPQVWYTGSAVDQEIHEHGLVLTRVRERGHAGTDPSLFYAEWSAADSLAEVTPEMASDAEAWARANPAFGIRISPEYIANERREFASNVRGFAVERLGVGDWPSTDPDADRVISMDLWDEMADEKSSPAKPFAFAFDVTPDRSTSVIAVAGRRRDGLWHVEVAYRRRGTDWLPDELARMAKKHSPSGIFYDSRSAAEAIIPALKELGVDTEPVSTGELAQACGMFYDAAVQNQLRHRGQPELTAALDGAKRRVLGDSAWLWNRKTSLVDISPLVACTIALWGAAAAPPPVRVYDLDEVIQKMRDEGRLDEGP